LHISNVIVFQGDILTFDLPQTPYKIFAGIPYNLSADILHKIVSAKNPPLSSYLIVQQEFAEKVIPSNENNSQLSILLGIQFEAHILHYLRPGDFYPRPRVKSVLLEITKLSQPLILADQQLFRDFVITSKSLKLFIRKGQKYIAQDYKSIDYVLFQRTKSSILLHGQKYAKPTGRIPHLMQPVVKKYNASDVASGFSHEYSIGIHKTGPRTLIVFLTNTCFR
jgi:16S rRNA A1518/A1519 N6-dimethyltransferase RsmA/KsgA/DIM1 with predicted DNA glycosylase/AP lyase activity